MGTLANRSLRIKRMEAHKVFNRLWESGMMSRTAAYHWLQVQMGLPPEEAHIAKFSEWRCEQVIRLCRQFLTPNTLYDDDDTTCDNLRWEMMQAKSRGDVTLAVANLYLRKQITFQRLG